MRNVSWLFSLAAVAVVGVGGSVAGAATATADWRTGGQNLDNSRYQPNESAIDIANVANLAAKFAFSTGGDVSATPAVDGQNTYFPDSAGNLFAIDRSTGEEVWRANIAALSGINTSNGASGNDYARATPAIAGQVLIIGTQSGKFQTPAFAAANPNLAGAYVLGLDKSTGELLWKTRVHEHFAAFVTQSAQVNGNTAYVGVASNEEAFANQDFSGGIPYVCCSFRGRFLALDTRTGAIKWATYTLPGDEGYSGAPIWGSTPAIDEKRGAVYVTTGNNYSLPADRIECVNEAATFEDKQACLAGDNFDAIMSFDLKTGAINWSYRALASDAWNTDCGLPGFSEGGTNPGNCPENAGPDFDFGQGPMLLSARIGGKKVDIVGAGGKSGVFTALDRATGAVLWSTQVGPGGLLGGLQWGSATDGERIYVAESNSSFIGSPGWWSALDPATGAEIWRTYDPGTGIGNTCIPGTGTFPFCFTWAAAGVGFGYSAQGPVSVANGVVYACSLNPIGSNMYAMDAATGQVKWSYPSGASCLGGAAIANGTVYWGTGYRVFAPLTTAGSRFFAFTLNGS